MGAAYRTLQEWKAAKAAALRQAVEALCPVLASHARGRSGRYLLYGSTARGALRHDSDIDLLLDFPPEREAEAWRFAEQACWDRGLSPDIRPRTWCRPDLLARIRDHAVTLG